MLNIGLVVVILCHFRLASGETIVNCFTQTGSSAECAAKGCQWNAASNLPDAQPRCYVPSNTSYALSNQSASDSQIVHRLVPPNHPLYSHSRPLTVTFQPLRDNILRVVLTDNDPQRFVVGDEVLNTSIGVQSSFSSAIYEVRAWQDQFYKFQVVRRATNTSVFGMTNQGLLLLDQYLQMTVTLPSNVTVGFGEHFRQRLLHDFGWQRWTLFSRDAAPIDSGNLYGVHPFYLNVEPSGLANGVFLKNTHAMDIVLQDSPPAVSYNVIGGVFDFFLFLGPSPADVVRQYMLVIGKPKMPPFWSLGFQLSRWGYDNTSHVRDVVERNRNIFIPFDVVYGDIDYMNSKLDFTYDQQRFQGLPELVADLHAHNQRYVVILDPAISSNRTLHKLVLNASYGPYEDGLAQDIFIKHPDTNEPVSSVVWPGLTVFPDFTHPAALDYWTKWCRYLYNDLNIQFSGLWIDMNEPSNFDFRVSNCNVSNQWNRPPYMPNVNGKTDGLMSATICMEANQTWGRHYAVHSLYGYSEAIVTYRTLQQMFPSKRPFVLSRSTFAGSGKYTGHWLGDNRSEWPQLAPTIIGMIEFGLFGIPYIGADICGFWKNNKQKVAEELCQRWQQIGAFYPFSRNHNAREDNGVFFPDQDPATFSKAMQDSTRKYLLLRYRLLPYMYTLFAAAHSSGDTVVRSLLEEFVVDQRAWAVDRQFLLGSWLMISPVLDAGATSVSVYFPANTSWYGLESGTLDVAAPGGTTRTVQAALDFMPAFVRAGAILPRQPYAGCETTFCTTQRSRTDNFELHVYYDGATARGSLYWDDGESADVLQSGQFVQLSIVASGRGQLQLVSQAAGFNTSQLIDTVVLYGSPQQVGQVWVDGLAATASVRHDAVRAINTISNLRITLSKSHNVNWTFLEPSSSLAPTTASSAGRISAFGSSIVKFFFNLFAYFYTHPNAV